ncbi:hypothetical protein [Spartinivicinus poritis]|uniref:Uncharacterized protein n=1 Tax=Spartinivicinus poritis TaxID=2994640 RepID=A0ABT5U746_9GAMM|nr:hypothetical protein [Spartinivicinus sp. A2-2]MDE1462137.1 hypothetical protein [Spartinivicinus sp. A2-2]
MIWDIPALLNTAGFTQNQLYENNVAGHFNYRWEDIAAALGMGNLPAESYYLGRFLIFDDQGDKQKLIELITMEAHSLAETNDWQLENVSLEQLALLACEELKVMSVCGYCNGLGFNRTGEDCNPCLGYGWKGYTEKEKYQFIGVNGKSWYRRWQLRYTDILNYLGGAAYHLREHLEQQLC